MYKVNPRPFHLHEIGTYVWVRPIVVGLDVVKVGGGLEGVMLPIQPAQPTKKENNFG